uniref:HSF-type DNA-binding domain-containing protein n=1 Tax=Leptocylindrus danicus TaxID=163516 RepID=A0A6U2PH26_9STRA|mmetsp:Transcript_26194/g.39003  ORF Transcript_26194/g.39003 Transcript_26194/m.39003 type:complete len:304 (+) Transcript_26194:748-1659(+)
MNTASSFNLSQSMSDSRKIYIPIDTFPVPEDDHEPSYSSSYLSRNKSNNSSQLMHAANSSGRIIFPVKLHEILSDHTIADIISWQPHGRSFKVHKPLDFEKHVIHRFFKQTKFASFTRQVNGWGFKKIMKGPDKGSFYHDKFLRGHPHLCTQMKRLKKKESIDPFYALRDNCGVASAAECNLESTASAVNAHSAMAADNGMLGGTRQHLPLLNNFNSMPSHIGNNNMHAGHVVRDGNMFDTLLRPGVSDVQNLMSQAQLRQLMEQNVLMNNQLQLREANNAALLHHAPCSDVYQDNSMPRYKY